MSETRKVRWGILSTANIGMTKVIPAIMKSAHSEVVAISSRRAEAAHAAAETLGIGRAYGSYEAMLADPDIDAIYNPLPNHLHVDLTLAANAAGKHVLCEKPIALNAVEATRLRAANPDCLIMEGFMVRFHPQWLRTMQIIQSGEIGEVRAVRAVFSYHNIDPASVRNMPEIGGGAMLDIGCYPIAAGRYFFESEPSRVFALLDRDPVFGTDRQGSVVADFGDGRQLSFLVSTQLVPHQSLEIVGATGRVEMIIPFNAPQGEATALLVDRGHSFDGTLARREVFAPSDQYTEMTEAFALAALGKRELPYGIEDSIKGSAVLDAVFASERASGWAPVKHH